MKTPHTGRNGTMRVHEQHVITVAPRTGGADGPPVLVPAGLPPEITRLWVTFLRSIGDVLRDEGKDPDAEERVSASIRALVPHDDLVIGRIDTGGGIVWIRPTDKHDAV